MAFIAFLIFSLGVFAAEPPLKWSIEDELKYYDSLTEKYGDGYSPVPLFLDLAIKNPKNEAMFTNATHLIGKSLRFILVIRCNQTRVRTDLNLFYLENLDAGWKAYRVRAANGKQTTVSNGAGPSKKSLDEIFQTVSTARAGFWEGGYGYDADSVYITVGDPTRIHRVATYNPSAHTDVSTNGFNKMTLSAIANVLSFPTAKAQPVVESGGRK